MPPTDEDLAFARFLGDRSPEALGEVFDRTAPKLLVLAAHLVPSGARGVDAEDLLQATFLNALESIDGFDARRPVLPWLMGILTNLARSARRRGSRGVDPERYADGRTGTSAEPTLAAAADREFGEAFAAALARLSPEHRRTLVLHLVHGMTSTQIAHAEGCPAATVKSRIRRGTEMLRRLLPAGFAASVPLFVPSEALALARAAVLEQVPKLPAPVPATELVGGWTSPSIGAAVMMKKVLVLVLVLLAGLAVWWTLPGSPLGLAVEPVATGDAGSAPPEPGQDGGLEAGGGIRRALPGGASLAKSIAEGAEVGRGVLRVRVTWRDGGGPATGIPVLVRRDAGNYLSNLEHLGVTDHTGTVTLGDLAAGARVVAVAEDVHVDATVLTEQVVTARLELVRRGAVRGRVVDGTGGPVGGAHIHAAIDVQEPVGGDTGVRSGPDGTFELPMWSPWLSVHARLPGHAPSDTAFLVADKQGPVSVRMVVGGSVGRVRGVVRWSGPAPSDPARVWLYPRSTRTEARTVQYGAPRFAAARVVRVDQVGRFEFLDVPPGEVVVKALAPPYGLRRLVRRVDAGGTVELEIDLVLGARLEGSVRDAAGKVLAGVTVFAGGLHSGSSRVATSAADGSFALDSLPIGSFSVTAFHRIHGRASRDFVGVSGEVLRWDPVLGRRGTIRGRVIDAGGRPLVGWFLGRRLGKREVRTDATGTFALEAPVGVAFELRVFEPRADDPTQHRVTPRAVLHPVVADDPPLEIRIDPTTELSCSVTGSLLGSGGEPVPGQQLRLIRESNGWVTKTEDFRGDGSFAIEGLPAGDYVVKASSRDHPLATVGRCVLVRDRATAVGALVLVEPVPVEIRLRRSDGKRSGPAARLGVSVLDEKGGFVHGGRVRLESGRLDLPLLPPGKWRIQISGSDVVWTERRIELFAGTPLREEIVLETGIPCQVEFQTERPVAGTLELRGYDETGGRVLDLHLYESMVRLGIELGLATGRYRLTAATEDGRQGEVWVQVGDRQAPKVVLPIR